MKIIAIGDIHGRTSWKKIIKKEPDADKIIFMADYCDNFDMPVQKQITNLKQILGLKMNMADRVVLLFGNHDYHYLKSTQLQHIGFDAIMKVSGGPVFDHAKEKRMFQMCYVHENFLFSHAGVTKTWCANNNIDLSNVEDSINDLFIYKPGTFEFSSGDQMDKQGNETCQSPIWVRPPSLREDMIGGFRPVVGHTCVPNIVVEEKLIQIDTLGESGEYLQIADDAISVKSI